LIFITGGEAMIIQKADLFKNLSPEAMQEISKIMKEESHEKNTVLYTTSSPAQHFFILIQGRVRLTMETAAKIDYTLTREGEIFGWSSMVGRSTYTAGGECVVPTRLVRIDKDELEKVFQRYPSDGMTFYKGLSAAIARRLMENYSSFLSHGGLSSATYGTGQVMSSAEE